mmetsp:Transcript_9125/g.23913  ORF Transcript_9125/g.23913 Transcript_9125/m.23913 type:complete len:166 (-) Transcript_9125:353-850(-)
MLRNMLDADGQDQYDSGGWCFPKPIPPVSKHDGQGQVLEPMMPAQTNEAFAESLREYPDEDPRQWQKHTQEWESVQGGSILTICKLHPSQRPPMVRPEDDNELGAQDVEAFIKNLVENGQPVVKTQGLGNKSLSSGKMTVKGAPKGVDANNFDGQRSFTGIPDLE